MEDFYHIIINTFYNAPIFIEIAVLLIIGFFLAITVLIIYLKHTRRRLRNKERIQETYRKKYESELISYLYAGDGNGKTSPEQQDIINYLKKNSHSSLKRKIMVSTLLKLRNEISGEVAEAIQTLYYQIGLENYAANRLKNKKWNKIAKGIRELTLFQIKEVHDEILLHINHPRSEVRKEVQMYLVNIFYFDGLEFLNVIEHYLSEWDQIQLIEILQKFENQQIPDINPWLKSTNDSVVLFALKLAKIYNQSGSKDILLELLDHDNLTVRVNTIDVLNSLYITEAVPVLKERFSKLTIDEQIAFFSLLENMHQNNDLKFIFENINNKNFEIKVSANTIMKELNIENLNAVMIEAFESETPETTDFTIAS